MQTAVQHARSNQMQNIAATAESCYISISNSGLIVFLARESLRLPALGFGAASDA